MFREILVSLIVILFLASPSFAGRPLTTDDAGTVDRGMFELEMGYDFIKNQDESKNQSIGISLKHGITERLDFGISIPYEIEPMQGLSNAEVGVKFALLEEKENIPGVSLTFSSVLGSSEYTLNSILSKQIWRELTVHLNLGYVATGEVDEKGVITYSGAFELPVSENLNIVGEVVGEYNADSSTQGSLEGLLGGNLKISDALTLDLGISVGFNNASPKWGVTLGLTYGF